LFLKGIEKSKFVFLRGWGVFIVLNRSKDNAFSQTV